MSKYLCKRCGHQLHSDLNAAINIKDNYILSSTPKVSEEQADVNQAICDRWKHSVTNLQPRAVSN